MIIREFNATRKHPYRVESDMILYKDEPVREIVFEMTAEMSVAEYRPLMNHVTSKGIASQNFATICFGRDMVTADIIEKNKYNEEFLLSLLKQNVGVVAKEDTFPFEEYAQRNLEEFYEKYKLLIEG